MTLIKMSLYNLHFKKPNPGDSQRVAISITAGKRSPRMEKQTAPTNDMMGPKFGIATASKTERKKIIIFKFCFKS